MTEVQFQPRNLAGLIGKASKHSLHPATKASRCSWLMASSILTGIKASDKLTLRLSFVCHPALKTDECSTLAIRPYFRFLSAHRAYPILFTLDDFHAFTSGSPLPRGAARAACRSDTRFRSALPVSTTMLSLGNKSKASRSIP
jgi:hypothetical protein